MPLEFIELLAALETFLHGRIKPLVYSRVHMKAADITTRIRTTSGSWGLCSYVVRTLITLIVPLRCAASYEYEYTYEKILQ
eukprot:scaffold71962_cov18-Prasinocladus_malaysianus.AAC.1